MRSWDERNSSFAAAILFSNIRNFANYSDDCLLAKSVYIRKKSEWNGTILRFFFKKFALFIKK